MKILHIGNLKTGVDVCVRNILKYTSTDFEFAVINGADDRNKPYQRNGHEVRSYQIPMYRSLNPINDIRALIQAVKIIKKEKPDLVHCHSAKGGVIGRFAAFFVGKKAVYTPHAFSFLSAEKKWKSAVFRCYERIARLNSYLLGCSDSERLMAIQQVGYSEEKAFVWTNSIPLVNENQISRPQSLGKDDKYIVTIARPCYQKNPMLMVEIMRRVHERFPQTRLYVVGADFYSPLQDEILHVIEKYNLLDTIRILPWISHEEALGYLKYSLFYLSTSIYEGLPIAVLEAMALGKAIVATDVIGNRDCVINGYNGHLLPIDVDVFTKICCKLIDNEDERECLGQNSRFRFESKFLIDNRIGELEDIYRSIIRI